MAKRGKGGGAARKMRRALQNVLQDIQDKRSRKQRIDRQKSKERRTETAAVEIEDRYTRRRRERQRQVQRQRMMIGGAVLVLLVGILLIVLKPSKEAGISTDDGKRVTKSTGPQGEGGDQSDSQGESGDNTDAQGDADAQGSSPDNAGSGGDVNGLAESESAPQAETEEPYTGSGDIIRILAAGDNFMNMPVVDGGRQLDGSLNYESYYAPIKGELEKADIAVINQETILGGEELIYSGYPAFNSPQEMGDSLAGVGFNVVLHATEHAMDKGKQGIVNTIDFWKENHPEVTYLGFNESEAAQKQVAVKEVNGIKVAMLNYAEHMNGISLPEKEQWLVDMLDENLIRSQVKKAKAEADLVVVFPHWGEEYSHEVSESQQEWTTLFAELGVDLVIGSHPHVIQPVEWVDRPDGGKMLVYYSLGNIISRQDKAPRMLGGLARVTVEKDGDKVSIIRGKVTPTVTHYEYEADWNFGVYKLNEYTDIQAHLHGVADRDHSFSLGMLNNLAKEVFGDFIAY